MASKQRCASRVGMMVACVALLVGGVARAATYYLYDAAGNRVAVIDGTRGYQARATVSVTGGSPGTVALVGNSVNLFSVTIVASPDAPANYRRARFTFTTPMVDADYVVMTQREYPNPGGGTEVGTAASLRVVRKTTTYFDVALAATWQNGWYHIDYQSHPFSVLVVR